MKTVADFKPGEECLIQVDDPRYGPDGMIDDGWWAYTVIAHDKAIPITKDNFGQHAIHLVDSPNTAVLGDDYCYWVVSMSTPAKDLDI